MEGRCPECSRAYDISDEFLAMGGRAKCPHCLLELEFPPQVGTKKPVDQFRDLTKPDPNRRLPASRQQPEELDSHCSSCGRHFKVDKEYLAMGGSAQCPHCAIDLVFDESVSEPVAEPEADYSHEDDAGAPDDEGEWAVEDGDESYDSVLEEGDTFVTSQPEEPEELEEPEESDPWAVETELNLPELAQVGGPSQAEPEPAVADSQDQWPESEGEAVAEDSEPTEAYEAAGFEKDLSLEDLEHQEEFTTDLRDSTADSLDQDIAPEPSGSDLPLVVGVAEPASDPWESPNEESIGEQDDQLQFGEETEGDDQELDEEPTALQQIAGPEPGTEPAPEFENPFGQLQPAEEPVDLTAAFAESESDASAEPFPGTEAPGEQDEAQWPDDAEQEQVEAGTPGDLDQSAQSTLAADQASGAAIQDSGDDGLFTGLASTEDWASAAAKWAESGFQANEMPSFIQGPEPAPEPEPEPLTPGGEEQPVAGPATEPDAGGQVILGRMTEDAVEVSDADILMLDDSEVESIEEGESKPTPEQETWASRASREVDQKATEEKAKTASSEPSRFARLKSPPILAGLVGLVIVVIVGILWVILGMQDDIESVTFPTKGLAANVVEAPAPPEYEPKQDAMEHYGLGNRLAHDGKFEDAILEYKQASRLDPGYPHPHRALGSMYAALGKRKLSSSSYEDYLRLAPDAPDHAQVREIIKTARGN